MRRISIVFFLSFIIAFAGYAQVFELPVILVPPSVQRGYPLKVLIFLSDSVTGISIKIMQGDSVVLKANAFFTGTTKNRHIWVGLLGIPSYFKPGVYDIKVIGRGGSRNIKYRTKFNVVSVDYTHEKIKLSTALTELRSRKDPLVKKQTKDLVNILYNFNRGSVFSLGKFDRPVNGRVSAHFGDRRLYIYSDGETVHNIHNGIDFAVPVGTKVHACADGRVVFADRRIITGKSIILEHLPEVYSIYYHLSEINVKKGQMVKRDEVIGKTGATGLATGPHLHWEVRVSGVAVNPEVFLKNKIIDKSGIFSIILAQ